MSQANKIDYLYNPANQSYEQLLDRFVIRKKEFKRIVRALTPTGFDSLAQHFLIEGQRGTGKTSLLLRVKYEIEHNEALDHLVVVQFAEEQYNIFDLCRLWESTAEALEDTPGFTTLAEEMEARSEDADYATECFAIIEKYLHRHNKRLVLLLDNFGDILDKLSDIEQKRLRDIFHHCHHIQLIASSSRALEHTYKHDKPFFEFFSIIKLDGLNQTEVTTLLAQLAKHAPDRVQAIIDNQPNRLETLRRLTGGIPRTIVLLFEIFVDDSANVFEDLEMILDRVTPLYKHRMDDLPTQQQAIMDTIALSWDGVSAKEIVAGLKKRGFDSKKVSAQLILLSRFDLVSSKKIDKKNKLYFIQERFFNIWYLMRYGRKKNKSQVIWLVRFLQQWCDHDEIIHRAKTHIHSARANTLHSRGGYLMAEALAAIVDDVGIQHQLLDETKKALRPSMPDIDKKLGQSDLELSQLADAAVQENQFELAIKYWRRLTERGYAGAMYNLGVLYNTQLNDVDTAIKYYHMAIAKDDAAAMNNLGVLYETELNDLDSAIKYYQMAIAKDHAKAMFNLGVIYDTQLNDVDNAIKYYQMAIAKDHVDAMYNLALLYHTQLNDFDSAIKYYHMAIAKDHAKAMSNLAWLYYSRNTNKAESLQLIEQAVANEKTPKHTLIYKHTLATILLWHDDYQQSISEIRRVIASEESESYLETHFEAMIDYFILLLSKKQLHLALGLFNDHESLKSRFKPVYYALMTLLKAEYPKEYLKMGGELTQTVDEILVKVTEKPQR